MSQNVSEDDLGAAAAKTQSDLMNKLDVLMLIAPSTKLKERQDFTNCVMVTTVQVTCTHCFAYMKICSRY